MPKGGYTLAHDPLHISVFEVIKASGETRRSLHNERRQRMGTVPRYQPLRMVTQVVEDMLHEFTIEDIDERLSRPAGLA